MIHVVETADAARYADALEEMFRQRARIFRDKMGWDVVVDASGRERDRFDDLDPVYLLHMDEGTGELLGSLRLLPTTGPTLMGEVFGDTIPSDFDFEAPSVWECTRFCAEEEKLTGRADGVTASRVACELLFAVGEIGIPAGIETVVANFVPPMLRVYKRAGCEVDVLGKSDAFGAPVYMGAQEVSERVLNIMRSRLGIEGSLIYGRTQPNSDVRAAA